MERGALFAGVELGGTKCVCILAHGPDSVIETRSLSTRDPQSTLGRIAAILLGWQASHPVASLGIASFGPLDLDRSSATYGHIVSTPKPGWSGTDLTKIAGDLPCAIDTDVNGAALAEGMWGASQGLQSWCYITLGTGVGVAPIVNGQPVGGIGHAEAGHMRVPVPDPSFAGACTYHGNCVEGLISGPALAARTGMEGNAIPDDHPVWNEAASVLAHVCHNLVLSTASQAVIVGGGVAQRRPQLLTLAREKLVDSLAGYASGAIAARDPAKFLVPPGLGDMAGPLGAIALAARRAAQSF